MLCGVCAVTTGCERAPIRLWLAGDLHVGGALADALDDLPELVGSERVGFVNLEGPIATQQPRGDGLRLFNHPAVIEKLRQSRIRAASVANNHALDAGQAGHLATIEQLRRGQVTPVGGRAGVAMLKAFGQNIAWVAHGLPGEVTAAFGQAIAHARGSADFVVGSLHVTGPPSYLPAARTKRQVADALAAGADVVVVHGQHAVGRVERQGKQVVAWGLGNVAFACDCTQEPEGIALLVDADATGVREVQVVPLAAGLSGHKVARSRDKKGVLQLLEGLNTRLGERTPRGALVL